MGVVVRCCYWLLAWLIIWLWITVGARPTFGQGGTGQAAPLDTAAVRDSVRILVERVEKLVGAITPPDSLHFGYDIFSLGPGTFEPPALGAVDPGYPIGPGDEIVISVWGQVELNHTLTVDREGSIMVPKVGRLQVGGVPLGELQRQITRFLSRSYSGIREGPTQATTFVNVSLGKLRSIKVFVVGEVQRPRAYTLNATSTVLNALYHAVGPTPKGSLRNVRLVRHDEVAGLVDLYRFILDGDKSEDVRLQNGDVILVPPAGKMVRLKGQVHRPAIYELKAEEGLKRLIEIAGGLEPDAYAERVQIEQTVENGERAVIDVDFRAIRGDTEQDVALHDGDVVTVFKGLPQIKNAIYLKGYVKRPGRYQLHPGMRVSDLIREADGVWPEAFLGRADIVRTNPDLTRELVSFHLKLALEGDPEADLLLKPLDAVTVHSIHTFGLEEFVTIQGRVKDPGRYDLLSGMTLKDLIVLAGGAAEGASKSTVEVSRVMGDSTEPIKIFQVAIDNDYSLNSHSEGFLLRRRDMVFVRSDPDFEPQRNVKIEGEVMFPGSYTLQERQERLSSLIARAGGLRETAYVEGCEFYRAYSRLDVQLSEALKQKVDIQLSEALKHRVDIQLSKALKRPEGREDPVLVAGDSIFIPRNPGVILVTGEVFYPRAVRYKKGKNVDYYLKQAGGLTKDADKGRIYVVFGLDPFRWVPYLLGERRSTMPPTRPPYPPEFKKQMVELVRAGRTPGELAKEFEPSDQTIRNWVVQADRDEGLREDGLTSDEREELRRLRREIKQLRIEREILSKAAAWFAQETNTIPRKPSSS